MFYDTLIQAQWDAMIQFDWDGLHSVDPAELIRTPVKLSLSGIETTAVGAGRKSMTFGGSAGFYSDLLTNGTGTSQANGISSITGTVTAGSPVQIDLQLPDPLTTLSSIKTILIKETTNPKGSNHLLVGDSAGTLSNACTIFWTRPTGTQVIASGGASVLHNPQGYAILAPNSKLQLAADTGTATYQIDLIGVQ